ncbi:MAG: nucleotide sugar dehydrogenase [Planctomycetota bacterium]
MRISIFGMGYVGAVSGACLARRGHHVVGVDLSPTKVDLINAGKSPIVEEGMAELMQEVTSSGRFSAGADAESAVRDTDVSFVSVGTPSASNGSLSLRAVEGVSRDIGRALKGKKGRHVVVYRSTILPGTTEDLVIPILEAESGRKLGDDLEVCFNPEFLREGSSIRDFYDPPFTVVGTGAADAPPEMREIYEGIDADFVVCPIRVAESVKYLCNMYHAVKVSFANEAGSLLADVGVDAREVMEIFCKDEQLNISTAYLRPGFAFGGSCLPKDMRAFLHLAKTRDVVLPMLEHVLPGNEVHIDRALRMVTDLGVRRIAMFGLAFKGGTDDLRESAMVALAERMIGKGFDLRIYDAHVNTARLTGANKEFIEKEIPHIDRLLQSDVAATLEGAEAIVIANASRDVIGAIQAAAPALPIVDLQGADALAGIPGASYRGICW